MQIGLNEVFLTCNIDNSASRKIIEKNGGKLLRTVFDTEENEYLYKYCITLISEEHRIDLRTLESYEIKKYRSQ